MYKAYTILAIATMIFISGCRADAKTTTEAPNYNNKDSKENVLKLLKQLKQHTKNKIENSPNDIAELYKRSLEKIEEMEKTIYDREKGKITLQEKIKDFFKKALEKLGYSANAIKDFFENLFNPKTKNEVKSEGLGAGENEESNLAEMDSSDIPSNEQFLKRRKQ